MGDETRASLLVIADLLGQLQDVVVELAASFGDAELDEGEERE